MCEASESGPEKSLAQIFSEIFNFLKNNPAPFYKKFIFYGKIRRTEFCAKMRKKCISLLSQRLCIFARPGAQKCAFLSDHRLSSALNRPRALRFRGPNFPD